MKKTAIKSILLLFIFTSVNAQKSKNEMIHVDGVYEINCYYDKDDEEGTQEYLRFYPNGEVISVATDCTVTAQDLANWFNKDMEYLSLGKYETKRNKIRFYTTSNVGTVQYEGKINKKGILKLNSKSLITGYKMKETYHFVNVNWLK